MMRAGRLLCIQGIVALVFCCRAEGQEVSARAFVDSTWYSIGDWITVQIRVSHPQGVTLRSMLGDTVNGFHVIQHPAMEQLDDTSTTGNLVVARYDSGKAFLPGIPFIYHPAGDTVSKTVTTNPLLLTIQSPPLDAAGDIKDIKPPLAIPLTLTEILIYAAILVVAAAIGYLVYRYWKKKQMKRATEIFVPPARPAHIQAFEELAILKEKKLWQQGLVKQYYSEVTEIVRRYMENRYGLMALEKTTDEILEDLQVVDIPQDVMNDTDRILRRADLVKFAKYLPAIPEHEEMLSVAYSIVEKTKAVQALTQAEVLADVEP